MEILHHSECDKMDASEKKWAIFGNEANLDRINTTNKYLIINDIELLNIYFCNQ